MNIKTKREKVVTNRANADLLSSESENQPICDIGSQSSNPLSKIKMGLKACKDESGFYNPMKAFDCLNDIVKKEDPKAYQPEVDKIMIAQKKRDTETQNQIDSKKH